MSGARFVMPLQKAPNGLLEQFRLRDGGHQPRYFGEVVEPSCDVRDFYGASLLTNTNGAPTVGSLLNLTETVTLGVPARVRAIGAQLTVGAAAVTAGGHIEVGVLIPGTGIGVTLGAYAFGVAAATQIIGYGLPLDIVWPAGVVWFARCGGTAAGADHSLLANLTIENYTGSQG